MKKMIDKAISVVNDTPFYGNNLLVHRVMDAAIATNSDWIISNASRRAELIMNEGRAKYYDEAITWLAKVKAAYLASQRSQEWSEYRNKIVTIHGKKRKLMGLMKTLD